MRCFGEGDPLYAAYHDLEWGRPVRDERGLFEHLCLEGFQAGLSWRLVLERRPFLRRAFRGFDLEAVAALGTEDIAAILETPGVIRHRGKVEAAVGNARATLALHGLGTTLVDLVWAHRPAGGGRRDWPPSATTPEATALARSLRRSGFRFIGPTTAYALMQACGVVNDHGPDCPVRGEVEAARRALDGGWCRNRRAGDIRV